MLSRENQELLNDIRSMADAGTLQGMFSDIPSEVYHAGPATSSSQIKPYYARLNGIDYSVPNDSRALRFGTAFHTYMLEPDLFSKQYKVGLISNDGRESLSPDEMDLIRKMASSFRANSSAMNLLSGSKKEVTCYSTCPETGILQKARADLIHIGDTRIISDIKTTMSANQNEFTRASKKYLYKISLAFYHKVFSEVLGNSALTKSYLIACAKESNHDTRVYEVSSKSLQEGSEAVMESLKIIRRERDEGQGVWTDIDSQIKEIAI